MLKDCALVIGECLQGCREKLVRSQRVSWSRRSIYKAEPMVRVMLGFQLAKARPVVPDSMETRNKLFLLKLLNNQPKVACKTVNMIEADSLVTCAHVPFVKLLNNLPKKLHGH